MAFEEFKAEVDKAVSTLTAIAQHGANGFGDGYKQIGTNISIPACECAAEITGFDATFCKMLNYKFRTDWVQVMFERARNEATGANAA